MCTWSFSYFHLVLVTISSQSKRDKGRVKAREIRVRQSQKARFFTNLQALACLISLKDLTFDGGLACSLRFELCLGRVCSLHGSRLPSIWWVQGVGSGSSSLFQRPCFCLRLSESPYQAYQHHRDSLRGRLGRTPQRATVAVDFGQ